MFAAGDVEVHLHGLSNGWLRQAQLASQPLHMLCCACITAACVLISIVCDLTW